MDSVSARKAATRPETHSAALEEEYNLKRAKAGLAVCLQFTVHCIGTRSKHWKKLEMQCHQAEQSQLLWLIDTFLGRCTSESQQRLRHKACLYVEIQHRDSHANLLLT